jgi:phage terminase small subunit
MSLKEKQEKFCQNYILHNNATRAAKDAGYSEASAYNQGYRLLQETSIQERIEELRNEMSTDIDVITEIEKQYEVARNGGHGTTALKALELLSRVRGNNSDSEEMSAESLEREIIQIMEVVGFHTMIALMEQAFPAEFAPLDDSDEDLDEFTEEDDDET